MIKHTRVPQARLESNTNTRVNMHTLRSCPTAPDFHAWEMIDQHEAVVKDLGRDSLLGGGEFPMLSKFYEVRYMSSTPRACTRSRLKAYELR